MASGQVLGVLSRPHAVQDTQWSLSGHLLPTGPASTSGSGCKEPGAGTVPRGCRGLFPEWDPTGSSVLGVRPSQAQEVAKGHLPMGVSTHGRARAPSVGPDRPGMRRAQGWEQRPACQVPNATPTFRVLMGHICEGGWIKYAPLCYIGLFIALDV